MLLGWLVYQERKDLPSDLARQLKAAFTSEIDARQYASLMRNVSVMAGYKDTYVVKKSDIDVSRVLGAPMAKKSNLKSVRLSDQVMDYVINFEGDGFNQKFENLVLFCMEQEEAKKQRLESLDQQITKQYKKLETVRELSSEIGDVRRALTHLERQTNDLSVLMDKLLKEEKEKDDELPFP